jgi:hypothetical protein
MSHGNRRHVARSVPLRQIPFFKRKTTLLSVRQSLHSKHGTRPIEFESRFYGHGWVLRDTGKQLSQPAYGHI